MRRLVPIVLVMAFLVLPAGCVFGGEMTAEKLESKLDNEWDRSLETLEDVHCREGVAWDFWIRTPQNE